MLNKINTEIKNDTEKRIQEDVQKYGWSMVGVYDDEKKTPSFAYTIGLYKKYGTPEIVVYGMDEKDAVAIFNNIANFVASGSNITTNQIYSNFIEDSWPCTFIEVDKESYQNFGFNQWYYNGGNYQFFQCVWADEKGNFPWESEFNKSISHLQVMLGKK